MYVIDVCQGETVETLPSLTTSDGKDWLPIKLGLFSTLTGRRRWIYADPDADSIYEEPNLITQRRMLVPLDDVKLLSRRDAYTVVMVRYLSNMGVPQQEQPAIIEEIFKAVDVAVPKLPVVVAFGDVTFVDSGGLFPATKSAIQDLEKVRLNSLDEATITGTPSCVICLKGLDHQQMITQLPCSHIYHGDCIVSWLETSHFCPVCRYSMSYILECQPLISEGQSASPSIFEGSGSGSGQGANPSISEGSGSRRRRTPPLLMIYASGVVRGIVTVMLLRRLWKRS